MNWRIVNKKFDGHKKAHDYIELFAHVYVVDNGHRRINPPYVYRCSKTGFIEPNAPSEFIDSDKCKMRCFIITKWVIPGYFKPEKDFDTSNPEKMTFENFFGKSYREIVEHIKQNNFENPRKSEPFGFQFKEI